MANVTETSTWETGIYQLETTDPVEGGAGGISNQQAKQLGNRTKWLKDHSLLFLRKANYVIGDVGSNDVRTVTFPNIGTNNYMVLGQIVSLSSGSGVNDAEITFAIKNKGNTSFQICLGEQGTPVQHVSFDYVIIPF